MPWNSQNGGWQGGNRGPWGQGPSGGGGGGGRNDPPDLDDLIRRGQERLRNLPGGVGGSGGGLVLIILLVLVAALAWTSVYRVDTDEEGVVLRFGEYVRSEPPGLHFKLPYPVETVQTPVVTRVNKVDIGYRDSNGNKIQVPEESLMLTGDENIIDAEASVFWRIKDAEAFLFNVVDQVQTIKQVSESAIREVVGQSNVETLQTEDRDAAQEKARTLIQSTLDDYKSGIHITEVKFQNVEPPAQVIAAYRDVQAAQADRERLRNEAESYANTVVPRARGEAEQIIQAAQAYREQIVADAEGQAQRFLSIYEQYEKAQDVTRKRIYLETMEEVLGASNKLISDGSNGSGVLPYLPLNELTPTSRSQRSSSSNSASENR